MKVTAKGQVTIPKHLRTQFNIEPGTELQFSIESNSLVATPIKRPCESAQKLVQRLRGTASVGMSTDQIMALTRDEQ
ncbi:MAG TPA: AbrB/MazE/SpoVT family DNA-binding domain-containing protein [Fimbriimonadaceae bacterium]